MELQIETVNAKIEKSLNTLAGRQNAEVAAKIRPILYANLAHGRMSVYLEGNLSRVDEYIDRVVSNYNQWHRYLNAIQVERDSLAWEALFKKLNHFAYRYLLHKGFDASLHTHESAEECATNAAISILNASFPYDTHFDAWCNRIVQNTCLKFMRTAMRKKEIPNAKLVELAILDEELLTGPHTEVTTEDHELTRTLNIAVQALSENRRQVILMSYFYELPPAEIAKKMGKSIDAVYGLHFNALKDLQKFLEKTGILLNEY